MNISVLYSLSTNRSKKSAYTITDDDTSVSAQEVCAALAQIGHTSVMVPIDEHSIEKTMHELSGDMIFNLIEWTGVDLPLSIQVMELLEAKRIPFTGATKENYLMTTDKLLMKEALDLASLSTPNWQEFQTGKEALNPKLHFPLIIKLSQEHCSIGLDKSAIVINEKDLFERVCERLKTFQQPVFAEEYIDGREFQVTVYEKDGETIMLPPAEIPFKVTGIDAFLTYESRWIEAHPDYHASTIALAKLSKAEEKKLQSLCLQTFTKLQFRDYSRIDIRMNANEEFFILEANSNPGLTDDDLYGMTISYRAAGMTFKDFIAAIINSCIRRFSILDK